MNVVSRLSVRWWKPFSEPLMVTIWLSAGGQAAGWKRDTPRGTGKHGHRAEENNRFRASNKLEAAPYGHLLFFR